MATKNPPLREVTCPKCGRVFGTNQPYNVCGTCLHKIFFKKG
jgi:DNA-directed RNA polymerase subunit RPC12/RpoP